MTAELIQKLKDQTALHFKAHSVALALREWTKDVGFEGSHKWLGRFQGDQMKVVTGLMKFLMSYADVEMTVPMVVACPAMATSLPQVFEVIDGLIREAQEGFRVIADMADTAGQMDVESFADGYLRDGIGMIKKLTRFRNKLAWIGEDKAALMAFDDARR